LPSQSSARMAERFSAGSLFMPPVYEPYA
jgi:hypothetical protein